MGTYSAALAAQDDAESTSQDVADDNSGKALVGALSSITNPSTTEEAKTYARKFLDRNLSSQQTEGEEPILSGLEKNAEAARAALQKARESLLSTQAQAQRNSQSDRWLAAAQAFGAPTKSGSFFENLSDYAGIERKRRAAELEQQQQFAGQNLGLDTQLSNVDKNVLDARLQLQKLHEQNFGTMGKEALNILGRPALNPKTVGATPSSVPGKIAVDKGLIPGTPAFTQFVTDWTNADTAAKKARAGIDVTPSDPVAHADFATSVGVPADVPNPWQNLSTKERTQGEAIEQRKAAADFSKYPELDNQTKASLQMIEDFQNLNKQTHTGPELAPIALGGLHAGFHGAGVEAGGESGWNINPVAWLQSFKPNIQEMNKISANLSTLAKPQGFGNRVTNFDLQTFQKGMLGVDKNIDTNNMIATGLKARLQNELDWHEFEQNYFQVYGHRRGAEAAWNQYLHDNPIFDPTVQQGARDPRTGRQVFQLNPHRQDYKTYFANHNAKAFAAVAEPPTQGPSQYSDVTEEDRNAPEFAGLSDEAIHNAKIPARARGGRIGFAEGGSASDALNALKEGLSLKTYTAPEDPDSPATNFTGEAVGAGGLAAALLALSRLGRKVGLGGLSRVVAEHPNIASSVAGGTAGAIAGGAGSRDADPGYDAMTYGLTGALAGPLARYGIHGATEQLGRLADRISGNPITAGDRRVIGAMQADSPSLGDISARLRADARARVPSTLADAAGPRTQGLAAAALAKDTPETRQMGEALANRQEGANARVGEKVNQALAPDPYLQKSDELTQALRQNAEPFYQQAYQQFPAIKSQALFDLMNTPAGQEAAQRAVIKMQNLQKPIGAANPVTGMVEKPSLEYLDHVKRSLDDMITREEGSGANYQATDDGRILRQMRNKLVSEIDTATAMPNGQPGPYQLARQQYRGDLEVRDALRSGNEDFNRMTPAELQQRVAGMSFAERDAFRSGVAENLFQKLNQTSDNVNPAAKITNTPGLREKLGVIFEKPGDADRFLQGVERESQIFDQAKPQLGAAKRGAASSQVPPSLATMARATLMRPETAGQITANLNTVGPDAQAALKRLQDSADRLRSRSEIGNLAGTAGAAGLAAATSPSPMQGQQ